MQNIPIANVPVQSFSVQLDDDYYDIVIRSCAASSNLPPFYNNASAIMAVDITRNSVPVVLGQRAVAGTPLLPYPYMQVLNILPEVLGQRAVAGVPVISDTFETAGNFMFVTADDQLPDYTQFGITQFLIYASPDELAGLNVGT